MRPSRRTKARHAIDAPSHAAAAHRMESAEHVGQAPGLLHRTGLELQRWGTDLGPGLLEAVFTTLGLGGAHADVAAVVPIDIDTQDVAS